MDNSYVPSPFTLTLMEGFGTKKNCFRTSKSQNHTKRVNQNKIPDFAKTKKPAYDKENLLQQIRHQKKRTQLVKSSTIQLLRTGSQSRCSKKTSQIQVKTQVMKTKQSLLNRQIQSLTKNLQMQKKVITEIKTSKKYNRFMELKIMKEVYEGELKEIAVKKRSYKHELRQRKNIKNQTKYRNRNINRMNEVVQYRLGEQLLELAKKVDKVDEFISDAKLKFYSQKKEKQRLKREIFQLQKQTGVVYLFDQKKKEFETISPIYERQLKEQISTPREEVHNLLSYRQEFESQAQEQSYSATISEQSDQNSLSRWKTSSF